MTDPQLERQRKERRDARYMEVKVERPDLYEHAVQCATAIAHNHQLSITVAADIEDALMSMAIEARR